MITIKAITRKQKVSSAGKPYTAVGIQTEEYPDQWINGFGDELNKTWQKGDRVEAEVYENKGYLNFKSKMTPRAIQGNNNLARQISNDKDDRKAWGMCKYGFLNEVFLPYIKKEIGISPDELEREAEDFADRAVRKLNKEDIPTIQVDEEIKVGNLPF